MRKKLRVVNNFLLGRRKTLDQQINLDEALSIIEQEGKITGNIVGAGYLFPYPPIKDVPAEAIKQFIKDHYPEESFSCAYAYYQTYSGRRSVKHYLDLEEWIIGATGDKKIGWPYNIVIKSQPVLVGPFEKFQIDFITEKRRKISEIKD